MRAGMKSCGFAPIFLTTALFAVLFTLSSRPARATVRCDYVTNGFAFYTNNEGGSSLGQTWTMSPSDHTPEVHVLVTLSDGDVVDVGESGSRLVTVAPQGHGHISDREYYAAEADAFKTFPIYSIYTDPCTGQTHTFTVYVKVTGNDGDELD